MTQEEIIELAKQCGIVIGYPKYQDIETFAKLVAEKEREACAKVCEEYETNNDTADTWLNIVSEVIRAREQA